MSVWTDEQVKLLKHLWPDRSASQIALVLGKTKNAVIGRANRLHLQAKELGRYSNPQDQAKAKPVTLPTLGRIEERESRR